MMIFDSDLLFGPLCTVTWRSTRTLSRLSGMVFISWHFLLVKNVK